MSRDHLQIAREHCFMAGVDDVGMQLCAANVPYGLAKIHRAQEAMGVAPDATFVGAPDATITRNERRWSQGFGYGGMYAWSGEFAVLDIKPNACGMIVGALDSLPELSDVRARLHELDRNPLTLDGIALDNDLTEANHFVDVFRVSDEPGYEAAPGAARYVFIMHSSGHEHRERSPLGPGLYWDKSAELRALARVVDTPWGSLRILTGEKARAWYEFYHKVQDFNHRRRAHLADFLFGGHQVLVNATHQGMVRGFNRANIGCYTFASPTPDNRDNLANSGNGELPLFPLTLSPTLPAFLVRPRPNLDAATIDALGWRERVDRHGLHQRIAEQNILPHGGGYRYPHLKGVARVLDDIPDGRRFELIPTDPGAPVQVIETPRHLPYTYRGLEVKERMEALGLGRAVVKLELEYVLTAE